MIRRGFVIAVISVTLTAAADLGSSAAAHPLVFQQVSRDSAMKPDGTHSTEVEPATLAWGRTIVSAFQVGRDPEGGAHDIGTATSTDAGHRWSNDLLPGATKDVGGTFQRASDPSVAIAAQGHVWLVGFLGISFSGRYHEPTRSAIQVSRSADGVGFQKPVTVATAPRGMVYDKPWFGCDNQRASPHAGQCYAIWDALPLRQGPFDVVYVSVSVDAGAHWSTPERTQNHARGFGAVPVIEPDGGIVVVYLDTTSYPFGLDAFTSVDGGATWGTSTRISVPHRTDVTGVRDPGFPSVAIDPSGEIYVVWSDCRFEPRCRSDQLVLSRSANGRTWSHASAVGVAAPSGSSLLTPALAVRSHGHRDELGIIYLAVSAKGRVRINRVTSRDGDSGWSAPTPVGWRSRVRWFTPTRDGYFWGDYVTASFLANGRLIAVVPLARRPSRRLDVAMYAAIGS